MTISAAPASDNRIVWYAGYGSNLLGRRFDCYVKGGKPEGSKKTYPGCRDKSDPRGDQQILLPHALYFGAHSKAWNAAVAFIRCAASEANTYARMYLITYGQFNDVVRQENGKKVPGNMIVPPYEDLACGDLWTIDGGIYSRLMKTGTQDGHPILTFTATRDDFAIGAPSEAYIKMIVSGLEETYPCMCKSEILDYLDMAEGIRGAIQGDVLTRWVLGH
jgi:hypothetical protein